MSLSGANRRPPFSLARFWAVVFKEFVQMMRDRLTFAMTLGIPLVQLILFGFAINSDPKHLSAAVVTADNGPHGRTLLYAIQNSSYLDLVRRVDSESEANELLERGEVQFVINIPVNFTHDLLKGDRPVILLEADATDPAATSNAIGSMRTLINTVLQTDLRGPFDFLSSGDSPVDLRIHARYNPESITQYNIVPGLMGVVLQMTMTVVTGLAITRELERGTIETLLAMPTRPIEVMTGKIIPYILMGYIQVFLILAAAYFLFHVPMAGSLFLLLGSALVFIIATLAVGITFSTLAKNQLQAVQMGYFFFLPSLLLSGFMFPFRGMPHWAQTIGELLPLTHFLRIARGILLKGNGLREIIPQLWPIVLFIAVTMTVAVKRYRRTLD
jgi:ABC-2 type transport system permease protein